MDWDVLIPILMFAFPVVVALLDKRAKKRRGVPPVQSRPVFPRANEIPGQARNDGWSFPASDQAVPEVAPGNRATLGTVRGGTASEAQRWGPTQSDVSRGELPDRRPAEESISEGQRAISRARHQEVVTKEKNPEPKLRIDKKNLILYSEILKPKFDA